MNIKKLIMLCPMLFAAAAALPACGEEPVPAPPVNPVPDPDTPDDPTPPTPQIVSYTLPDREIRGVWVATVGRMDWPKANIESMHKDEFIKYLDAFEKYNVNAVIMQIRPCADAFYDSPIEPWSEYLCGSQGRDPGYDVLGWMIDQVHARGMEFHAWMNPYRVSNSATAFAQNGAAGHPAKVHPEWTMKYGNLLMYRPACPEVKQLLVDVVDDLISKYDVDGIHFDDYFYPYPSTGVEIDDADDYKKYGSAYSNVGDFRRAQVDDVIQRIHNLLISKKPGCIFSISPFGIWRNKASDPVYGSDSSGLQNYDDLYADVRKWCEEGWIDLVVPQLYNSTTNIAMNFTKMCKWWNDNSFKATLAIGHALYRFGVEAEGAPYQDLNQLNEQFRISRANPNTQGSFMFNATCFKENKINILSRVAQVYADKALIPVMGPVTEPEPATVGDITVDGRKLIWKSAGDGTRYAIYRVKPSSTDGVYEAKLVEVTAGNSYTALLDGSYAVAALNRDNVQSELTQPVKIQ
ncbi:MAG: family 10 glycosylhydrolase [Muribaculaceae bacterium]|nr:family 10 glycosylhydrolase [Muribaculaceae bacterium]